MPENAVGKMNMKRFRDEYSEIGMNVNVFSDPDEAMKWLIEQ